MKTETPPTLWRWRFYRGDWVSMDYKNYDESAGYFFKSELAEHLEKKFFHKAHSNLLSFKSISGNEIHSSLEYYFDWYRDDFLDILDLKGFNTDLKLQSVLCWANQFSSVGDFLCEENQQMLELSAFGLVLFDRLNLSAYAQCESPNLSDLFFLFHQLHECWIYVLNARSRSFAARNSALKRHAPLKSVKAFIVAEWRNNGHEYGFVRAAFARHYADIVKREFGVEVTERTIATVWLRDNPDASKQ